MIWRMFRWPFILLCLAAATLKSRRKLLLENLALRHQLLVLGRNARRPRLNPLDRALWAWLSHCASGKIRFLFDLGLTDDHTG